MGLGMSIWSVHLPAVQRRLGPVHQQGWEAPGPFSHHSTSQRGIQGTSGLLLAREVLSHVLPGFLTSPSLDVPFQKQHGEEGKMHKPEL